MAMDFFMVLSIYREETNDHLTKHSLDHTWHRVFG